MNKPRTIQGTIPLVATALLNGLHPEMAKIALMHEGYTADKADIIIRWAKQHVLKNRAALVIIF